MNDRPLVIGIDIGSSGARALAMSTDGVIIASQSAKLSTFTNNHRNTEGWWNAVRLALSGLLSQIDRRTVRAIALDGTSGTMLPVSSRGEVLAEPLMYNDPVDNRVILERIAELAPKESAAHGATSGLAKVLHFQDVAGVNHVVHQADWLSGHFTGNPALSDENNALKTGYDPVRREWPDWISLTGAKTHLLPDVRPAGTPFARISALASAQFDLPTDVLIVAGTTDGCASFLATGADKPGDGVTALGTTMTIKLLSDRPLFAPEYGLYSHRIGDIWLAGGASNTGGVVLSAHFPPGEIALLSQKIDPEMTSGLDYYPLARPGERFPINDPGLEPRLIPRPPDDADFLKGMFEGIAGIEALAYHRLAELGGPSLRSVRTVGGGAVNPVWSRIRARKLGVPFEAVLSEEAAAGTARLALMGAKQEGLL